MQSDQRKFSNCIVLGVLGEERNLDNPRFADSGGPIPPEWWFSATRGWQQNAPSRAIAVDKIAIRLVVPVVSAMA